MLMTIRQYQQMDAMTILQFYNSGTADASKGFLKDYSAANMIMSRFLFGLASKEVMRKK